MPGLTAEEVRRAVPVLVDAFDGAEVGLDDLGLAVSVIQRIGMIPFDAREAVAGLATMATGHPGGVRMEVPARFRMLAMEMLLLHLAGLADSCPHVTPGSAVIGAAHRPGAVCCLWCAEDRIALSGDEDNRCDNCGAIEPELWVSVLPLGSLAMSFGICERCAVGE